MTPLIAALREPARYPHAAAWVELIETHISWVLLAGEYAYKLKKPVALEFLDFSTLEQRRAACEEELRLNRRTAPQLYLEVVALTGSEADPRLGGAGEPIEYAVKMRRFAQDALADARARRGALGAADIDALAAAVAAFHAGLEPAPQASGFGAAASIAAPARQNFAQLEALGAGAPAGLCAWTERELARLAPQFEARRREGRVRECHGDLHLGNIAFLEGRPVPFDGVEFDPALRWIDVMSEIAFLVMDLLDHGLEALAWRCLNAYLEATGDYGGLGVLRFYAVYRAMVRAKVARIRARQPGLEQGAREAEERACERRLALAQRLAGGAPRGLVLMHGVSGAGKTWLAQALLERLGAVRVRSDVERKRLHGLAAGARSASGVAAGLYSPGTTRLTYERLALLARGIVRSGYPAIVDAAFLARAERERFRALARELGAPLVIASCSAAPEALRGRIARRAAAGADASEAGATVLGYQLATQEPLEPGELGEAVRVDTGAGELAVAPALEAVRARLTA